MKVLFIDDHILCYFCSRLTFMHSFLDIFLNINIL